MIKFKAMESTLKKLPRSTFELTVTLPWLEVKTYQEKITEESLKEVEVKGFRKGKAPKKIAEGALDKDKLFQEVIRQLVPEAYLVRWLKWPKNPAGVSFGWTRCR